MDRPPGRRVARSRRPHGPVVRPRDRRPARPQRPLRGDGGGHDPAGVLDADRAPGTRLLLIASAIHADRVEFVSIGETASHAVSSISKLFLDRFRSPIFVPLKPSGSAVGAVHFKIGLAVTKLCGACPCFLPTAHRTSGFENFHTLKSSSSKFDCRRIERNVPYGISLPLIGTITIRDPFLNFT